MKRRILPILLISVGVYVLIGCIPIPATQQYMTNGELKPSYAIGSGKNKPIRLGYTTIDEAIEVLSTRVAGKHKSAYIIGDVVHGVAAEAVKLNWLKLDEHRYALPYQKRAGYLIWPLCFTGQTLSETEFILLKVDDQRRVIDYKTIGKVDQLGISAGDRRSYLLYPPTTRPIANFKPTTQPR